ncbi:hypothetical protein PVOR_12460 [Paenibacillus vortex V453]|uniref:Uncharacterized protein n=1 Tax=Paenibacillus vortex V453 TaxID=715225 RepID=A0A2R9SWL0_9BACL|nr:hypothetical protein PVOR_12460 [Paenibacillus vortex V453]
MVGELLQAALISIKQESRSSVKDLFPKRFMIG